MQTMKQPTSSEAPVGLVLAAGQSKRYGSDKRLALLPGGQPLLQATLSLARRHFAQVIVVLGHNDDSAALEIPGAVTLVRAPKADIGLSTSIASAFRFLRDTESNARSAAVLLGDMPWIEDNTLERLKQRASAATIVRPVYQGQVGHPVFLGNAFWEELSELSGDDGAKSVVQRHREQCAFMDVEDEGVLKDVDRPGDLGR